MEIGVPRLIHWYHNSSFNPMSSPYVQFFLHGEEKVDPLFEFFPLPPAIKYALRRRPGTEAVAMVRK